MAYSTASNASEQGRAAGTATVVTADAQTQARLPADPEAAARAAVAAAALAQASLTPLHRKYGGGWRRCVGQESDRTESFDVQDGRSQAPLSMAFWLFHRGS